MYLNSGANGNAERINITNVNYYEHFQVDLKLIHNAHGTKPEPIRESKWTRAEAKKIAILVLYQPGQEREVARSIGSLN